MPTVLLIAQAVVLLVLLAGFVITHFGPISIRHKVARYYYRHFHPSA